MTKRRQYSEALKRQMVAETQAPGASVSIVARRHDVNSNQLFRWRRQLLPKAVVESGAMVPVEIAADDGRPRAAPGTLDRYGRPAGLGERAALVLFQLADSSVMPLASGRLGHEQHDQSVLVTALLGAVPELVAALIAGWIACRADD